MGEQGNAQWPCVAAMRGNVGTARRQRSNAPRLHNAGSRGKHEDLPAFFLVWEHRHSYLDLRNDAAPRT